MILVAVGTQFPFDRLVETVDRWAATSGTSDVVAQIGPSSYVPNAIQAHAFLPPKEFQALLEQADLVIAHCGMGSILSALSHGKPIVVMPRSAAKGEHRNDHQYATAQRFSDQPGVTVAWDETDLRTLPRAHRQSWPRRSGFLANPFQSAAPIDGSTARVSVRGRALNKAARNRRCCPNDLCASVSAMNESLDAQLIRPVILSGGAGTRLWPVSRLAFPKQLLPIAADLSMLQVTALRTTGPRFSAPIIVGDEEHRFFIGDQLERSDLTPCAIILEPEARNTAPAIGLAASWVSENCGDDLLLVLPSDHVIRDEEEFRAAVERAIPAAMAGGLVTFGIVPESPNTGYGYIEVGDEDADAKGVHSVARFVEKPSLDVARTYLEDRAISLEQRHVPVPRQRHPRRTRPTRAAGRQCGRRG